MDLSLPTATAHGCYWYNLHLVLVTIGRYRVEDRDRLKKICDLSSKIAGKKGHAISTLSVMPDHVHLASRGNLEHSPFEIALAFQNNLAYGLGQVALWMENLYIGTFGEYDMGAVR